MNTTPCRKNSKPSVFLLSSVLLWVLLVPELAAGVGRDALSSPPATLIPGGRSSAGPLSLYAIAGQPVEAIIVSAGPLELFPSWFPCVGGCTGDLNLDGIVDAGDLGLLIGAWGTDGSIVDGSDINDDGIVNAADLGLLIGAWGVCN